MKKILLTTTALTMLAGAAVAEVSVSGSARMGAAMSTAGVWTTPNRVRINFSAAGETDGGLTFGARTRINTSAGTAGGIQGANVWISNGTATLSVGNSDGAVARSVSLWGGGLGFTGNGGLRPNINPGFLTSSGGGAGVSNVAVTFSLGNFNVAASTVTGTGVTEVGANFSAGGFTIGAGSSSVGTAYSVSYASGSFTVAAAVAGTNNRIWATYNMGPTTLRITSTKLVGGTTTGVGVTQSLGGGASVSASFGTTPAGNAAEIGMNFGF